MPTRMASGAPTPRNDIWAGCKRMHAVNTVRAKCIHYRIDAKEQHLGRLQASGKVGACSVHSVIDA